MEFMTLRLVDHLKYEITKPDGDKHLDYHISNRLWFRYLYLKYHFTTLIKGRTGTKNPRYLG